MAHVLMVHEEDYRRPAVGDLVHCRFTEGAFASVLIPDMPAIPLDHVAGLPDDVFGKVAELSVVAIPTNPKCDRDYKLNFVAIVQPK